MDARPAEIGDIGILLGVEEHGSVSGLLLQVSEEERAHLFADWRMAACIFQAFEGKWVEVVESEGSAYGAHAICLWEGDASLAD